MRRKIYFYNVYDKEIQFEEYDKHENGDFLIENQNGFVSAGYCNTATSKCLNEDVNVVIEYAERKIKQLNEEAEKIRKSIENIK